jgi:maltooligosyltrehalose trehalohydrolase
MNRSRWKPSLGACVEGECVTFRVWAPGARSMDVVLGESEGAEARHLALQREEMGFWTGSFSDVRPGDLYRYGIDGGHVYPDPASRFQPQGVHGPSQVIDPSTFVWSDEGWTGREPKDLVLYELHTGTFTPDGTFAAAGSRLPYLAHLGVTCVELMPVVDFPGMRNWGYDGADLFAPARCYGTPDDLRRFVNEAHRLGVAVLLDVVYNHFGPEGSYIGSFSPFYFTRRHKTPWGDAINLDGEHSSCVRQFYIENALYWIREFHMDGLRLDATHAMMDESPRHFVSELADRIREEVTERTVLLIAEDDRNFAPIVRPPGAGGWGLDAVWSDDFHHQMQCLLTGEHEGYYQDFSGSTADLAATIQRGWFFSGQYSQFFGRPRGTDPSGMRPDQLVFFLQNHDQVGNRAFGERLHHQIDPALYRAAIALFLCSPQIPLLFMGQEWAASTPFLYFTDHPRDLGLQVTKGRREEYASFPAFSDPEARRRIPDPQSEQTFLDSKLAWHEQETPACARVLHLHRRLLAVRKEYSLQGRTPFHVVSAGDHAVALRYEAPSRLFVLAQLTGGGAAHAELAGPERWKPILTTEDPEYSEDPRPIRMDMSGQDRMIRFERPGAIMLGLR